MRKSTPLGLIRTHRHIRTRQSIRISTGPGPARWPRLKETEKLHLVTQRLQARRRSFLAYRR